MELVKNILNFIFILQNVIRQFLKIVFEIAFEMELRICLTTMF